MEILMKEGASISAQKEKSTRGTIRRKMHLDGRPENTNTK
jgi:hypothetical protein